MQSVCVYFYVFSVLQIGTLETLIGSRARYSDLVLLRSTSSMAKFVSFLGINRKTQLSRPPNNHILSTNLQGFYSSQIISGWEQENFRNLLWCLRWTKCVYVLLVTADFFYLSSNVIQLPHKHVNFSAKQCGEFIAIFCCSKLVLVKEREFNEILRGPSCKIIAISALRVVYLKRQN